MTKEIQVEGYTVIIERSEQGSFTLTIPTLPGVIGQVKEEKDAPEEMRRLIGVHFAELASKKPRMKREPSGDDGGERAKLDQRKRN